LEVSRTALRRESSVTPYGDTTRYYPHYNLSGSETVSAGPIAAPAVSPARGQVLTNDSVTFTTSWAFSAAANNIHWLYRSGDSSAHVRLASIKRDDVPVERPGSSRRESPDTGFVRRLVGIQYRAS